MDSDVERLVEPFLRARRRLGRRYCDHSEVLDSLAMAIAGGRDGISAEEYWFTRHEEDRDWFRENAKAAMRWFRAYDC